MDIEKLAEYFIVLIFAYTCLYVNLEVQKKNKNWFFAVLLSLLCPFVVFMLMSVFAFPVSPELIVAVAILNIVISIFRVLKEREHL